MKPSGNNHMDQRIAYLIEAYLRETITPEEHDELDAWVGSNDENMRVFEEQTTGKNDTLKGDRHKKYTSIWDLLHYRHVQYSV